MLSKITSSTILTLKVFRGCGSWLTLAGLTRRLSNASPPASLKKTSGGVSWRWHGEAYRKGKTLAPFRPFPSHRDRFSFTNQPVSCGLVASESGVSASRRPLCAAMAAHKPVEWVQAVITRFDEQVRWVHSPDGCVEAGVRTRGPRAPAERLHPRTTKLLRADRRGASLFFFFLFFCCLRMKRDPCCTNTGGAPLSASTVPAVIRSSRDPLNGPGRFRRASFVLTQSATIHPAGGSARGPPAEPPSRGSSPGPG